MASNRRASGLRLRMMEGIPPGRQDRLRRGLGSWSAASLSGLELMERPWRRHHCNPHQRSKAGARPTPLLQTDADSVNPLGGA